MTLAKAAAMFRLTGKRHWGAFRSMADLPGMPGVECAPMLGDTANVRNKRYRWQPRWQSDPYWDPGRTRPHWAKSFADEKCSWVRLDGSYPLDL